MNEYKRPDLLPVVEAIIAVLIVFGIYKIAVYFVELITL